MAKADTLARSGGAIGPFNTMLVVPYFVIQATVGEGLASLFFDNAAGLLALTAYVVSIGGYLYCANRNEHYFEMHQEALNEVRGGERSSTSSERERRGWRRRLGLPDLRAERFEFWVMVWMFMVVPALIGLSGGLGEGECC